MPQLIPLAPVPSQSVNVQLGGQNCRVDVYQTAYALFLDLYESNEPVVDGAICQNLNRVVRDSYLGFLGDLLFYDSQGKSDPDFTGLGGRFSLLYLSEAEDAEVVSGPA